MHKTRYAATPNEAILNQTLICQIGRLGEMIRLDNGGFVTRLTCRGMNQFMQDNDIPWRVRIFKGEMIAERADLGAPVMRYFANNICHCYF